MTSMEEIKRSKKTVQNIWKITRAMGLVSTVKLQRARTQAEKNQPFFRQMEEVIQSGWMEDDPGNPFLETVERKPFEKEAQEKSRGVVVFSSNRGLAGGYNSNVIRLFLQQEFPEENTRLYIFGTKAGDYLRAKGYKVQREYSDVLDQLTYDRCGQIAQDLMEEYRKGRIRELYVLYTEFRTSVLQLPMIKRILPIGRRKEDSGWQPKEPSEGNIPQPKEPPEGSIRHSNEQLGSRILQQPVECMPNPEKVWEQLIGMYIQSMLYGGFRQAAASENSARVQAMDNGTKNASQRMEELTIKYNQARQQSITQELTEIIAGAEVI